MKNALTISGLFHVVLLVTAAMEIPWFDSVENSEMVIIPVEILQFAKETRTKEIAKFPNIEREKPKPPEKRPIRQAKLPPPPPKMLSTMPLPNQVQRPTKNIKVADLRSVAPEISQREKPKPPSRYNSDRIAQLLNKVPKKENVIEQLSDRLGSQDQQATSLDVRRQVMSISSAIQKKIEDQCWNPPSGALDAGSLKVRVKFYLTQEGKLARPPVADDYVRMAGSMKVAADSALRAVRMCAPYSDLKLPQEMYDQWREVILNFDPSGMIG